MNNNMDPKSGNNFPWELISGSFTGSLTPGEHIKLQKWLSASQKNLDEYGKIKKLWEENLDDYSFYHDADENKSWNSFLSKIKQIDIKKEVISDKRNRFLPTLVAIAAGILFLIGIGWLLFRGGNEVYESTSMSGKKIVLKDGSLLVIKPGSKIEISSGFNRSNRVVLLVTGEAYFRIVHITDKPFIVNLGATQVRDLGTSFRIRKGNREINLDVISGKVEFRKTQGNDSRLLIAGSKITYDIHKDQFGEIQTIGKKPGLSFDNTPLSEVVTSIQDVYHKKVVLEGKGISDRRLTANLDGMDFTKVMEVICRTLDLEYSVKNDSYIINDRQEEQP